MHTLEFGWGDAHLNVHQPRSRRGRAHRPGTVVSTVLYHHDTHTQALMPLNCRSWIAVAPAFVDFSSPVQVESVRAFLLDPLACIRPASRHLALRAVPARAEPVRMLNVQGRRYEEDNAYVDLDQATGVRVTVRTSV